MPVRLAFIRPLSPSASVRPPKGDDWLHEPKWDGYRFQIIKDGSRVRFYSRHGAEYTDRLSGMVEAFGKLPTQSAILDGELILIDPRGAAHFYRLMAQMRTSSRYSSGPSRNWVKVKCPGWKRINAERWRIFKVRASQSRLIASSRGYHLQVKTCEPIATPDQTKPQ